MGVVCQVLSHQRIQNLSPSDGERRDALATELERRLGLMPQRSTEQVRALRREFSKQLSQDDPEFVTELALSLIDRSDIHRFIAYELVQHHKRALTSLTAKKLEQLGSGLDSWVAVDTFACYLAGPVWRERQVEDDLIRVWARSADRWWRRAALVSTVPLNNKARGGSGDVSRTLDICKILITDHDEMVVKAMSWALRELGKRDAAAVRKFINSHQKALASRVIREVNNKLETGLKNPGKSGKA